MRTCIMKNLFIMCYVFALLFVLTGCGNAVIGHDGLISKAREEITVSEAETIDMQIAGSTDIDNRSLIWFITGNQFQSHSYFPMEFKITGRDSFEFIKSYKPMDRGDDISVLQWHDGYSFLINNSKCRSIFITDNENTEVIEIDTLPFLYYYEGMPSEYTFRDADNNELN